MTVDDEHIAKREKKVSELTEQLFTLMIALPARLDNPKSPNTIRKWARQIADIAEWETDFKNGAKNAGRGVVGRELMQFAKAIKKAEETLVNFHNPSFGIALDLDTNVYDLRVSLQLALDFANKIPSADLEHVPEIIIRGREHSRASTVANKCWFYFSGSLANLLQYTTMRCAK